MEKVESLEKIEQEGAELEKRLCLDNPDEPGEAELAGPWEVVRGRHGEWAVSSVHDGEIYAEFMPWETAAMFAATLPAVGRPPIYALSLRRRHAVLMTNKKRGFGCVGEIKIEDDKVLTPLHTATCILRSPDSLAWLLLAAERKALERAANIVAARLERYQPHGPKGST
ncbi:MAG: hypothetical protein V3T72_01390 [Thermoanaerobaculia bacterium]